MLMTLVNVLILYPMLEDTQKKYRNKAFDEFKKNAKRQADDGQSCLIPVVWFLNFQQRQNPKQTGINIL